MLLVIDLLYLLFILIIINFNRFGNSMFMLYKRSMCQLLKVKQQEPLLYFGLILLSLQLDM